METRPTAYHRQALFDAARHAPVTTFMPHAPAHHIQAVTAILVRNILSNRVVGLLSSQDVRDVRPWMYAYVEKLATYFNQEHALWLRLRSPVANDELLELIGDLAAQCTTTSPAQMDVTGQAFVQVKDCLLFYPFDLPITVWVSKIVRQCVVAYLMQRDDAAVKCVPMSALTFRQSVEVEEARDGLDAYQRVESKIDFDVFWGALSLIDQHILHLKLAGATPAEIALQVKLKPRTVYARVARIGEQLRGAGLV